MIEVEHAFLVNDLGWENISIPAKFSENCLNSHGGCVVAVEVGSQVRSGGR